jgi:hypothetical protein
MWHSVTLIVTDVSEEYICSIDMVTKIGELRTTLAVTSNWSTVHRGGLALLLLSTNLDFHCLSSKSYKYIYVYIYIHIYTYTQSYKSCQCGFSSVFCIEPCICLLLAGHILIAFLLTVTFYRDSMFVATMALLMAVIVRGLRRTSLAPPVWIAGLTSWVLQNRFGQILVFHNLDPKVSVTCIIVLCLTFQWDAEWSKSTESGVYAQRYPHWSLGCMLTCPTGRVVKRNVRPTTLHVKLLYETRQVDNELRHIDSLSWDLSHRIYTDPVKLKSRYRENVAIFWNIAPRSGCVNQGFRGT